MCRLKRCARERGRAGVGGPAGVAVERGEYMECQKNVVVDNFSMYIFPERTGHWSLGTILLAYNPFVVPLPVLRCWPLRTMGY